MSSRGTAPIFAGTRVVVFAREPVLGQVKTRLAAELGDAAALAIYQAMLQRIASLLTERNLAHWDLWVSSNTSHECFASLCNKKNIYLQSGADLGERMDAAMTESLSQSDVEKVLILGTDCPALTEDYLREALSLLDSGSDVVIGPAEDGGYVLIAANQPVPELFRDISWGSEQVLSQTLQKLEEGSLSYKLLSPLWDVDRVEDIARLDELEPPLVWR